MNVKEMTDEKLSSRYSEVFEKHKVKYKYEGSEVEEYVLLVKEGIYTEDESAILFEHYKRIIELID